MMESHSTIRIPDCKVAFRHPCVFGALGLRKRRVGHGLNADRATSVYEPRTDLVRIRG